MRSSKKTHKQPGEQWSVSDRPVVADWEAAHIFLEVARCGGFRAASQKLGQSVNALRRKVDKFESALGVPLLTRYVHGVQLTEEGAKIYAAAQHMETASFELLLARNQSGQQIEGEVRLSITEGLGTFWLLPRLVEFQRENPKLAMNVQSGLTPADLSRLEADISVQLERPQDPNLKVMKVGRLHFMLFASRSYLDKHGTPTSVAGLKSHRLTVLADNKGRWEEDYVRLFGSLSPDGLVMLRNNSSAAHFWSIVKGAGIGALPTYAEGIGAKLVPLDLGLPSAVVDVWMAYRSDAKRAARVRRTIEWLIQCYDPRRYPWFRDEFIHPERFSEIYKGGPLAAVLSDFRDLS